MLLQCLQKFLSIALTQWRHAINVMIEKDTGSPNLNRLRIIHLFEADYNLLLKLLWGSRLVRKAIDLDLLHPCQHGSVPTQTTMDAIMLTQLSTDLSRICKTNLARFDNNASACYDRIIINLAMLAARRCGMPTHAVQMHADALQFMRYAVKTVYGISESNYMGTIFEPLFGTGQGSGASPAAWLTLMIVLMQTLDRLVPERMRFTSPTHEHSRLMDAFVDDTALGFTDSVIMSCPEMIQRLGEISQIWERLLFFSRGALNLNKCSWYIMYWEWKDGRPALRKADASDPDIVIKPGPQDTEATICRMSPDDETRLLGVFFSPTGSFSKHLSVRKDKADLYAVCLKSPKLKPRDVMVFHKAIYTPAMRYSLPAVAVDEENFFSSSIQGSRGNPQRYGGCLHLAYLDSARPTGYGRA